MHLYECTNAFKCKSERGKVLRMWDAVSRSRDRCWRIAGTTSTSCVEKILPWRRMLDAEMKKLWVQCTIWSFHSPIKDCKALVDMHVQLEGEARVCASLTLLWFVIRAVCSSRGANRRACGAEGPDWGLGGSCSSGLFLPIPHSRF